MRFSIGQRNMEIRIDTRAILAAGAKAAEVAIRTAFRRMPSRSGFFAAQVTEGRVQTTSLTEQSAEVTVDSRELAHYIRGGPVYPIPPRRALAIPVSDTARVAGYPSNGRIPDLFMLKRPGRNPRLCTTDGYTLETHYVLVPSVTHDPHPDAWPEAEIDQAAGAAMQAALDAQSVR